MERKFTSQDVANELGNTVAIMAASSFNLIAAASMLYAVGTYLDNVPAKQVRETLNASMETLGYARASKFALAGASVDVARRLVKDFGRPDGVSVNAFWATLLAHDTAKEAVDFMVVTIRSHFGVQTVQELYKALKGESVAVKEKPYDVIAKLDTALKDASPADLEKGAAHLIGAVSPSGAKTLCINLASKLTLVELNDVLASMASMADAMVEAGLKQAA